MERGASSADLGSLDERAAEMARGSNRADGERPMGSVAALGSAHSSCAVALQPPERRSDHDRRPAEAWARAMQALAATRRTELFVPPELRHLMGAAAPAAHERETWSMLREPLVVAATLLDRVGVLGLGAGATE